MSMIVRFLSLIILLLFVLTFFVSDITIHQSKKDLVGGIKNE